MSHRPNAHRSQCDNGRDSIGEDEIAQYSNHYQKEREHKALEKQLEKKLLLAQSQEEVLREALEEAEARGSCLGDGMGGKRDQDEYKKERKSKKRARLMAESERIDSRVLELEQNRLKLEQDRLELDQDRRLFVEEKEAFEDEKRTVEEMKNESLIQPGSAFGPSGRNVTMGNTYGAAVAGDYQEAPSDDVAFHQSGGNMITATKTENGSYRRSIYHEIQTAGNSKVEGEGRYQGSIAPTSTLASVSDAANPALASLSSTNRSRSSCRVDVKGKPNLPKELLLLAQAKTMPSGKARNDRVCEARGRWATTSSSVVRFLAWALCTILPAIGVAMTIMAFLYIRETKKQRNLWLEANGLTRAYLLAQAPKGDVD